MSPIHCLRMLRAIKKASVPAAAPALMGDGERSTQCSSLDMMRGRCSDHRRVLGSGVASSEDVGRCLPAEHLHEVLYIIGHDDKEERGDLRPSA